MEESSLGEQVEVALQQLEALVQETDGWSTRREEQLQDAVADLRDAGESLCRHSETLASARETVDARCRRYEALFELAPGGCLITDCEGVIQEANRAAAALINAVPASLEGEPLGGFVVGEEREGFGDRLAQLRDGRLERLLEWDLRLRPRGLDPVWCAVSVASVQGENGSPERLCWLLRDISQRRWVMDTLRESEERYRAIADNIQDGLTIISDGQVVYANDRACEIFGYPMVEYTKMTSLDLAAPEEKERLRRMVAEVVRTGAVPDDLEYVALCKDGTRRHVLNRYSTIYEDGEEVARLVVTSDVTARRRAERTLRRRATQLALLNDVGGKIAADLELSGVLERAARLVQEGFGYHHVGLFLVDLDQGQVIMRTRAGEFADLYPADHRLDLEQGMVGWVGKHGKRLLANDVSAEPCYINLYPDVITTQSELSVPIRLGDEILGVLDVQSPLLDDFDDEDVMVIETLADQIATAIGNARLYETAQRELSERKRAEEALERRVAHLALLNDVGGRIAAELELGAVLERAARLVQEVFGYHHVGLFSVEREEGVVVMQARAGRFADLYPDDHRLQLGQGMVGWVAEQGDALLANDVSTEPHYINLYPDVITTQSELSVPIRMGGEIVGVFDVQSPQIDAFDSGDVMVIETLVDQIAVAMRNARLYAAGRSKEDV